LDLPVPREGYIPVAHAALYYRAIGQGPPIIILHGGPDFDHTYLLPDMDRLAAAFRLIYYDQRGRGKSAPGVRPADVSLASDITDIDAVRTHFQLDAVAVLGHSFGGLLAMAYALRHPERVSHLILLNTAPASYDDWRLLRQDRLERAAADRQELRDLASSPGYQAGDPDVVAAYYRVHFRAALRRPEHLDTVMRCLRASFTREGILKAWAIEERLDADTRLSRAFDMLPQLRELRIPTLVIHGACDLVPLACAAHIAGAIPGARFVAVKDCGHFSYLECPDDLRQALDHLFQGT
jgi:proline iminopeptidase